jgi:hypothetical protein
MNHAKPIEPDEMHENNETKKLREEGDGRHAWLRTAQRASSLSICKQFDSSLIL